MNEVTQVSRRRFVKAGAATGGALMIGFVLPGCATHGAMGGTLEANKQLCRDYFQAFMKRDAAWMQRHVAPTYVRHDPGLAFEVRGPAGVLKLADVLMPAFPDMRLPIEDVVAQGEKVLMRLRVQATHTGPFGDMKATGRKVDVPVLDLFQVRDNQLIAQWAQIDNLGLLKQLGVSAI